MRSIHPYTVMVLIFFWLTDSAGAWNKQEQSYTSHDTGYMHERDKKHHPRYDHNYPKNKKYRYHKRKHYRNTPSWKDYQRRLHYQSQAVPKKYDDGSTNRYNTDYTFSQGWELVRKGRPEKARDIFGHFAKKKPYDGEAKIGYAIASAQNRQMFEGVVAMRRALKYDPDALHRVPVDDALQIEIHELAENYQSSFYGLSTSDTHFMVASLYYLINDFDRCIAALEKNHAAGDQAVSTINLYRLAGYEVYN